MRGGKLRHAVFSPPPHTHTHEPNPKCFPHSPRASLPAGPASGSRPHRRGTAPDPVSPPPPPSRPTAKGRRDRGGGGDGGRAALPRADAARPCGLCPGEGDAARVFGCELPPPENRPLFPQLNFHSLHAFSGGPGWSLPRSGTASPGFPKSESRRERLGGSLGSLLKKNKGPGPHVFALLQPRGV